MARTAAALAVIATLAFFVATVPIGGRVVEAQESQPVAYVPTGCVGWQNADRATDISLGVSADLGQFTDRTASSVGTNDSGPASLKNKTISVGNGTMTCSGWKAAGQQKNAAGNVTDAMVSVSFAGHGPADGMDIVVLRYSFNGKDWITGTTFLLRDTVSNARNGGYATFPIHASSVTDIERLSLQFSTDFVPSRDKSTFFVDGVRVNGNVRAVKAGAPSRFRASSCSGFSNADAARTIDVPSTAPFKGFQTSRAAVITIPAGNVARGTLSGFGVDLTCEGFAFLRSTASDDIAAKYMVVSLAGRGAADGSTVISPSYSIDGGATWQSFDPISVTGEISNRTRGGYLKVPLPEALTREQLAAMKFRLSVLPSSNGSAQQVAVDGVELGFDLVRGKAKGTLNPLSFLSRHSFLPIEEPTVTLEVDSIKSISVSDASGKPVAIPVRTSKKRVSGVDRTTVQLQNPGGTKGVAPGVYTVTIRANVGGRSVVETQTFSWGILSLNTPKSSYRVGEDVPVSIGVVDDKGRTVCDADLKLTITSPDSTRSVAKTSDGRIIRSKECGPKSLTAVPDYLVRFKVAEPGTYGMKLSATTTSGVHETSASVTVNDAAPFVIERVAPSRINPKSPYKVHLFVKAQADFTGPVEEIVPSDFVVTGLVPDGQVTDRQGTRVIIWDVTLAAGKETELTYEFDAPDKSPALFLIGPARVAAAVSSAPWQIASDEVSKKGKPDLAYRPLALTADDWTDNRSSLAEAVDAVVTKTDQAVVKVFSSGFKTDGSRKRLAVSDVTIIPPSDGPTPVDQAEEDFTKDGKSLVMLYMVPNKDFRPGVYRVRGTTSDGTTVESSFEWGTFDLALAEDAYPVHSRVDVAFSDLDAEGNVECDNGLTLEVQTPSGTNERYVLGEGTIDQPVACGKAAGETQLRAHFLPTEEGTYRVTLARSTGAVRERVKDFTVVSRPKTPDDVAKGARDAVTIAGNAAFKADERPGIDVTLKEGGGLFGGTAVTRSVSAVQILDPKGKKFTLDLAPKERQQHGTTVASYEIDTSRFTRPGKYTATIVVNQGEYAEPVTRDFTWGVVALNVTRAIARPGDDQTIGMGVLDDAGRTICDATIALKVTDPNGAATDFSTSDGTIRLSGVCVDKGVTNLPDYFVTMKPTVAGQYRLHMEASTRAGTRTYDDAFRVQENLDFAVERLDFPTRIFPPAPYPVRMAVTPSRDYQGTVREAAPADFVLTGAKPDALVVPSATDPAIQYLQWTVDWKKGETYELGYTFDAPDVSPELFTLGPLEIVGKSEQPLFAEPRRWQLASDAVNIRVAGTLYSNEGTTAIDCSAANKTVKLEVNNTASYNTTCTLAAGTYDFGTTISVNGSDVLTVYISGATEKGSRTTRVAATPADITGADIYQNRAIVSHEDAGPITNANLDNWDSGNDTDMPYTVTTGALTVASGRKLIVWTGKTFTPGGSVTTTAASNQGNPDGDLDIQSTATLSMGTNALSVGGDYNNAGTFSKSTGQTTTFTGATTGFTIVPGTGNFDSVTFNGSGGGWSFSSAVILDVDLTMTAGTLSGTNNVTVNGGDATGNGTITLTGGTFLIDGAGNFGGTTAWTFSSLTFGDGTGATTTTAAGSGGITVTSVMTIATSQTLSAGSKTYTLSGSGTPLVRNGTFTASTSTVNYQGTSATTVANNMTYYNLGIGISDANSVTYSFSTNITYTTNVLTVASGDTFSLGTRFDVGNSSTGAGSLVLNGTLSGSYLNYYPNAAFPTTGTMNATLWMNSGASGSQHLSPRTYQQPVQLLIWGSDTLTFDAGTYVFSSNLSIAENSNGVNYTIDATAASTNVTVSGNLDFNGNSGVTGLEVLSIGANTWAVAGNVDFNDAGGQAGTFTAGTGLLKMTGTTKTLNTGGNALYDFEVASGGSNNVTMSGATIVSNNLTITSGNLTGPLSGTLSVGGSWNNASGTFTHNSGTVTMTGTTKTISGSSNTTFNNLTVSGTVTVTASNPTVNTTLTVDVNKSLTINSGLTVTLAANTGTNLVLNGTIDGAGTLTYKNTATTFPTSGTVSSIVRFDTANGNLTVPQRTFGSDLEAYGNTANIRSVTLGTAGSQTITVTGSVKVITGASQSQILTLDGATNNPAMAITGGISYTKAGSATPAITTGTGAWSAGGDVNLSNGTFTVGSGNTLTLNGTAQQIVTTNSQTFNGLTLNNTGTDGTANDDIVISGALDVNGTLTITDGQLRLDTNNPNVTTAGAVSISANGSVTKGTGTWTFDGTTATTYTDSSSAVQNLGAVTFNKTDTVAPATNDKVTLASSMTADTVTIDGTAGQADTLDLGSSGYTLTLANAGATATVLTVSGTLTIGTSTIKYTATNSGGNITVNALGYSSLNLAGSETYDVAANQSASGTVTVDTNATMSIATSVSFTHSGATLTLNGVIAGSGTFAYQSATAFPTSGTISAILRMDATNNDQSMSQRTYTGQVELYSNSGSAVRTITLGTAGSQTLTFSSNFYVVAANSQDVIVAGDTNNPNLSITGNVDFTGTGNGFEVVAAGTGTWTVSGNVNLSNGVYGPSVAVLRPTHVDTAQRWLNVLVDLSCSAYNVYSCLGSGVASYGVTDDGGNCVDLGIDQNTYTDRAWFEYNPTGISDSATILSAQVGATVSSTYSSAVNVTRSTVDDLASQNCNTAGGTYSRITGSTYGSVSLSALGNKIIPLGTTGAADVQSRITGTTSRLSIGLNNETIEATMGTIAGSASNYPALYATFITTGTPTLTMNGAGTTLTAAGNALYNVNLSSTITLANETLYVAGDLNLTSGDVTPGTSTVYLTGAGKTLTAPVAGDTLYNLTVDPSSAGTVTLAAGGGDLTVSNALNVASGDTLSIGSGRTLTLSGASGTTLTLTGTISGAGRLTYQNTATAFPATGTISSILRMDATGGNQTLSARTYGGAVELYTNSSAAARTITAGTAGSQTLTFSSDLTMNAANTQNLTLQGATWDPTLNITGIFDFTGSGAGTEIVTAPDVTKTWTVTGNVDLNGGTWTASAETLKMDGTANLGGGGNTVKNLTVDGSSNTVTATGTDITVSGTLTIGGTADGNDDTLSIASGRTVTSGTAGTVTFVASGTDAVSGSGTLTVQNSNLDTDGTLSSIVRFDATNGDITMPVRTYAGAVEAYNNHASTARAVTMASGTYTLQSTLTIISNSGGNITLAGATNNPTVNLTGDLAFTKNSTGTVTLTSGAGTWTALGSVNFSNGTYTAASGNTLVMNGTGTLTSNSQTLQNLTFSGSGTITLANAVHTISGNVVFGSSITLNAGSSTVGMNGSGKTIDGGGKTLYSMIVAGSVTLQNTDLTIGSVLNVTDGSSLTINASRTLTLSGNSGTTFNLNTSGTVTGSGTMVYQNSATTVTTAGTLSSAFTFDMVNGNQTVPNRTFGGAVELYSNSANVRTITLGMATSQTLTFSSNLSVNAANTADIKMEGSTYHPTVNLTGDFQSTGTGNGTEILILGDGTWTVSGNVNVTSGFLAIRYAELNPAWDNTGYKNENYIDDGFGSCILDSTTYSCETSTATSMSVGIDLQAGGGQGCPATDRYNRAYLKYDLSGIANTNTVILARQRIYPASVGVTPTIGHANNESPDGVACNSLYDIGVASAYNSWSPWTAGQNTETSIPVTDIQSRLGTTAFAEVIDGGATLSTVNTTDNASNKPLLRLAYVAPSTTPTFVMNGASKTLTVSTAGFYNLTLSGVITVGATSTTYIYGTLDMTGGTITNNTWPLVMAGSTTTIKGGGNTLGNLTVSANTSATLTGSDLGLSVNLVVNAGATLTIDNGRILTDGAATTTNIVGTIAANGSGLMVFTSASTGPGTGGTLSAPVRFDATAGNITSGIFDARTYGGAVELYSNSGSDRTVSTASGGAYVFSSSFTTTRASTGGLTFDMNTTDPASLTITGTTTVGAGTTISANSSGTFAMNGSYTNNGTFTHNSGTVTLAGSSQQTLSGTLTGAGGQFNNLTITNSSGTDPDSSPSVIFAGAAATAATFKAGDAGTPAPNVKLRFNTGSTYTFQNISLHGGAAGTRVFLRSSSSGTQWNLNVAGTRSPISYVNVRDSNACGQPPDIDASDGTNVSEANNNCWMIATLRVTLSANSVALGTLSPSTVTKGSITSTVTSSAPNGYISFIKYDHTLTAGSFTIPDAGGSITQGTAGYGASTSKAGQTIAQTTGVCTSGSGTFNASSLSTAFQSFASASSPASSDATTLCVLATPSISTAAGSYSSTATIVTTAKF